MKKKILFFIESLNCGGAEKSIVSLLQCLDYTKVEVDLMLLVPNGDLMPSVPKEVNIISFPQQRGLMYRLCSAFYSLRWRVNDYRGVKRHKAETLWSSVGGTMPRVRQRYDVAVAYNQGFPTYFVANHVKAAKKLAWVNTELKGAGYRERFNRRYYKKYDKVVAVSEELYEKLKTLNFARAEQLTTVYDILNAKVIRQLATETHPLSETKHTKIVTVGRLVTHKNYPLAIAAAKILKDNGVDFVWTIVGGGAEYGSLKALAQKMGVEDNVQFAGMQMNPYPYMADGDIYVQTSKVEGYGLTIAEAKILHKPIVSTDFPVIYDQISDGKNGLIAKMTPDDVADKILRIVRDKGLSDRLIAATMQEENTTAVTEVEKFYRLIGIE